ncbi:MAG: WD40 repeat domain-containing protein, partial [Kofleriaceae bacterium]
ILLVQYQKLAAYVPVTARLQPALAGPDGTCVGCHVAVSADGTRLAAGVASTAGGPGGILFDLKQGTIITTSDAMPTPWVAGAFDPSGVLVTSSKTGELSVRDPMTGEVTLSVATGELATSPAISPDGKTLAYTELDVAGETIANPLGDALHVRPWNAATGEVGATVELVRDARKIVMPMYSADGKWLAYGHTPDLATEMPFLGSGAVKTDGSGTVVELTTDPLDRLARFASAAQPGRMWVVFTSARPFGSNPAGTKQLWLEAFDPDTGTLSPAFHLPGQRGLDILHGPTPLP